MPALVIKAESAWVVGRRSQVIIQC